MTSLPPLKVKLPATELLSLAGRALGALEKRQWEEHSKLEALEKEDDRCEMMECLTDTGLVYSLIDPQSYYSERQKSFGEKAAAMPKGLDAPSKRYEALLGLGSIVAGKGQFVIPQAVASFREERKKESQSNLEEVARQNVLLDFLLFLAGNWDRSFLFELVQEYL